MNCSFSIVFAYVALSPAAVGTFALTAGRSGALAAGMLGLAGAIAGARALRIARFSHSSGRRAAIVALLAGCAGLTLGGLIAATAAGGIGTGNGLGGAIVAMALSLLAMILGGVALARSPARTTTKY